MKKKGSALPSTGSPATTVYYDNEKTA